MKHKHLTLLGSLALCGSMLVVVPSSYAGKRALNDKEMDQTTAAGQPRVAVGNGNQEITDNSVYTVDVNLNGQTDASGDSIVNAAGENNVGVAQNVANVDGGGEVDQINEVIQTRNASLVADTLALDGTATTASGTSDGTVSAGSLSAFADHIKIGHGDQIEEDDSLYAVSITDEGQQNLVAFSLVNVAGRNNVAVALNAANRDAALLTGGGAFIATQLNTISQGGN
jgi:hypothetical protein